MSSSEGPPAAAEPDRPVSAQPPGAAPSAGAAIAAQTTPPSDGGSQLSPERIAELVAVLDGVGDLPLADHVELYQRLHGELQTALAEIDGP